MNTIQNSPNPNFLYLDKTIPKQRISLLQGGTRSGKTFSIIYYILHLCKKYNGLEIDICRDTFATLKSTVWKDFKSVLIEHHLYNVANHNKTDKIYLLNGNTITYYGADDPSKIMGRSRDILWLNECNHLKEDTVDQLFPRTRHKIIGDYNPALPLDHWLDNYIDKYPPFKSTYKDNPFLTKSQIEDIESRKNNPYWWSVYGTGERARPEGAIFNNWEMGPFDGSLPYVWGMDFGFARDPDTLIKVAIDNKANKLYIKEYLYQNGLSTDELINKLSDIITNKNDLIIADCAEGRTITDLRDKGFNVLKSEKGAGSVRAGIKRLQNYSIFVEENSANAIKEFTNYAWHDKKSETPIDDWNHIIDPVRYCENELGRSASFFIV